MKKVYLIHGWGGSNSSKGWFGWLKKQLKDNKIEIIAFNMPNTENPKIEEWVSFLNKNIKEIDKETYFIGHSVGCQTILRFLEKLPDDKKIGGAVFVAGWFNLKGLGKEEKEIAKPWIESLIDFDNAKKHCNKFLAIFSNNDPYVPLSDSDLFKERLNAKIVIKDIQEHFNETKKIQEIIDFIK